MPHEWHARVLLSHVIGDEWYTLTPDADWYAEDLHTPNVHISTVVARGPHRAIPFGVPPEEVYDFAEMPNVDQLEALQVDARRAARDDRVRRGLPADAEPAPGAVVARAGRCV